MKIRKISQETIEKLETETNSLFNKFQNKFYRVVINGDALILKLYKENGKKFELADMFDNLMTYGNFHNAYAHEGYYDPTSEDINQYTYDWIRDPRSNMYLDGIVFDPKNVGPGPLRGEFNTYCGMSIQPDNSNSCVAIKQMIKDFFVTQSNEDHNYFEKYLTHMMKKPWELPKVAIVMRGAKGTGKGTLMEAILREIWSQHELNTGHIEQVTGKFNSATMNKILVYLAECSWGGYKDQDSVLKNMITNVKVSIEKKGKDVFSVKNYARVFISSNEEWCVPATKDDRRYFFINLTDKWAQDKAYFDAIYKEIENGGIASYLHYLMNEVDIENFKPWSDLPEDNLNHANDMIAYSYNSLEKFLDSWIVDGAKLNVDKTNKINTFNKSEGIYVNKVTKTSFYSQYEAYCVRKGFKAEEARQFYDKVCSALTVEIKLRDGYDCFIFPNTFDELSKQWDITMNRTNKVGEK